MWANLLADPRRRGPSSRCSRLAIVWLLFRATCTQRDDALRAGSVLTGAGEFAFVLLPLGGALGILSAEQGSLLVGDRGDHDAARSAVRER